MFLKPNEINDSKKVAHGVKNTIRQNIDKQESDYYDLSRTLLDFPSQTPEILKQQVDEYIEKVADIRRFARRIETGSSPSVL